jgi:hypothetical protein
MGAALTIRDQLGEASQEIARTRFKCSVFFGGEFSHFFNLENIDFEAYKHTLKKNGNKICQILRFKKIQFSRFSTTVSSR